jgi:hypothetical protein
LRASSTIVRLLGRAFIRTPRKRAASRTLPLIGDCAVSRQPARCQARLFCSDALSFGFDIPDRSAPLLLPCCSCLRARADARCAVERPQTVAPQPSCPELPNCAFVIRHFEKPRLFEHTTAMPRCHIESVGIESVGDEETRPSYIRVGGARLVDPRIECGPHQTSG